MAQTVNDCVTLGCDNQKLAVQIISDPDFVHTGTCQTATPCGNGDLFRQMYYKVRLVYIPGSSLEPLDFNLDYREVNVDVQALITGASNGAAYSFIDVKATDECHNATAQANGWAKAVDNGAGGFTNGVNFKSEETDAGIAFYNNLVGCPEAAVIRFTESADCGPGNGGPCAVADLFRIAVNAYPGETVNLNVSFAKYDYPGGGECNDSQITHVNASGAALLPLVAIPGTANGNMLLRLGAPVPLSGGGCIVEVELVNNNSFAVDADYLEFALQVDLLQAAEPVVNSAYSRPLKGSGNSRYVHFIVPDEGWQLAANGGTHSIGSITIKPPFIGNSTYSANLSLTDATKSRIKTPGSCTNLPMSTQTQVCQGFGHANCQNLAGVVFTVEGVSATDCNFKIRFGFVDNESFTPDYLQLSDFFLHLQIATSGDVQYHDAVFDDNWNKGCPSSNGCSNCISADKSGDVIDFTYCVNQADGPAIDLINVTESYVELRFTGYGCIENIAIPEFYIRRDGDPELCIPPLASGIPPFTGIPLCAPSVYGAIMTEKSEGVEDVNVRLKPQSSSCTPAVCPDEAMQTGPSGAFGFCTCPQCQYFSITPEKDGDDLNGVSTFDIVLINRHVLGLELLNSPYKIIAADADNNKKVTSFDFVELKKLILGIYTELPNNTSWRFVDKAFVFPDPADPFVSPFPESVNNLDPSSPTNNRAHFAAIKVGDVNGNAVAHSRPSVPARARLSWPRVQGKGVKGPITVPVVYTGADTLLAFQMALQFDPSLLQLLSPSAGDLPAFTRANYNAAAAARGQLRLLWFPPDLSDPTQVIAPGTVLFYLHFKTLAPLPEGDLSLCIDDAQLPGLAFAADGKSYDLGYAPAPSARFDPPQRSTGDLKAACAPNPGSSALSLTVDSPDERKARIALYDPNGVRLLARDVSLNPGQQAFQITEAAALPAGVYIWKVIAPGAKAQGCWIKQ